MIGPAAYEERIMKKNNYFKWSIDIEKCQLLNHVEQVSSKPILNRV